MNTITQPTAAPYVLPSPNIAQNHIVLIMSAELQEQRMQTIEAMADDLEDACHYLSGKGLHTQAIQIEPHGLGDLLIQLLNRRGVTTQSLATLCKPFACSRHPERTDALCEQQQPDGFVVQARQPSQHGQR